MQIDPTKLVEARLGKAMSQEEAAIAADLSVRTVQRIEAGHQASLESTKALLTIFGPEIIHDPEMVAEPVAGSRGTPLSDWLIAGPSRLAMYCFNGLRMVLVLLCLVFAAAKPILPDQTGLFHSGNTYNLGVLMQPPGEGTELLGYWFTPVMVLVAVLLLFSIRRVREAAFSRTWKLAKA